MTAETQRARLDFDALKETGRVQRLIEINRLAYAAR